MTGSSYGASAPRSTLRAALTCAWLLLTACRPGGAPPGPGSSEILLQQARAAERQRQYLRARVLYRRAIARAADRRAAARAQRQYASALMFWGLYRDAEQALTAALQLEPHDARSWHDLGILRAGRPGAPGAEVALRQAARLAPGDPRPRLSLAALLVAQRRLDAALREYGGVARMPRLPAAQRRAVTQVLGLLRAERQQAARPPAAPP